MVIVSSTRPTSAAPVRSRHSSSARWYSADAWAPLANTVRLSDLSTLERDRLQDTLGIVRRFRQHLQQHFRLGAL